MSWARASWWCQELEARSAYLDVDEKVDAGSGGVHVRELLITHVYVAVVVVVVCSVIGVVARDCRCWLVVIARDSSSATSTLHYLSKLRPSQCMSELTAQGPKSRFLTKSRCFYCHTTAANLREQFKTFPNLVHSTRYFLRENFTSEFRYVDVLPFDADSIILLGQVLSTGKSNHLQF
jgi:hypothetical protein